MNAHSFDTIIPYKAIRLPKRPTPSQPNGRYRSSSDYVDRFNTLCATWQRETKLSSSIMTKMDHSAFSEMTRMGERVLPLVFEKLRHQPSFLFLVAHEITGANPAPESAQGRVEEISEAWIRWANESGVDAD